MPKVVSLEDASERFGVSVTTLRRAVRRGDLRRYKVLGDRRVLVDPDEVARLLEPREQEPEP